MLAARVSDPNLALHAGWRLLHVAALTSDVKSAKTLLDRGAEPHPRSTAPWKTLYGKFKTKITPLEVSQSLAKSGRAEAAMFEQFLAAQAAPEPVIELFDAMLERTAAGGDELDVLREASESDDPARLRAVPRLASLQSPPPMPPWYWNPRVPVPAEVLAKKDTMDAFDPPVVFWSPGPKAPSDCGSTNRSVRFTRRSRAEESSRSALGLTAENT